VSRGSWRPRLPPGTPPPESVISPLE
jgi:hypothetical protein